MNYRSNSHTITEEINIRASAERVFAALTDTGQRVKW